MSSKKIVFINQLNNFSGCPKILANVIVTLKNEYDVLLITNKTEGFLSDLNIPLIKISYDFYKNKLKTFVSYLKFQFILFHELYKIRKTIDLIYINTIVPFGAGIFCIIFNIPAVYHIHEYSNSRKFGTILRSIKSRTKGIEIYVSHSVMEIDSAKKKKSFVAYNSLPPIFFQKGLEFEPRHTYNTTFNILMICSLRKFKGIFELFEIAKNLEDYEIIQFNLVLDASLKEIKLYFKNEYIPKNINILERLTNPIEIYKQSNLLLNLSRPNECVETFGLTILEGMVFGLPVIGPPIGGPAEIIKNNGYKISCYETEKISNKILELATNEKLWQELSLNSKNQSQNYKPEIFQNHIKQIIDQVLKP